MSIYSIDQLDNQVNHEPTTILVHPTQCVLNAPVGSGKTTLLNNLFRKSVFFKGFFDRIVIFSPLPLERDPKWQGLLDMKHVLRKKPALKGPDRRNLIQLYNSDVNGSKIDKDPRRINPADIHIEFDPDKLIEILEQQQEALDNGDYRLCVILEDCPSMDIFSGKKGKIMTKLATTLRHYQASVFYCTQSYMLLPRTVRNNCTHMIVWNVQNISERKRIHAEHPMVGSFENFDRLFDSLMRTPGHPFIFFNFRNPIGKQLILNFERIVST